MAIRKKTHKIDKKAIIDAFAEMAKEKKIEKDLLQGVIEETLSLMVRKKYGANADFEIIVNMQKGDIEIYLIKQVVETVEDPEIEISLEEANQYSLEELSIGDDFIEEITLDNIADSFGRRLVSYASQAMNYRINEVERNNIYQEYSSKIGQLIVGEIFQKRAFVMLVTHNGVEMKLPKQEQLPTDGAVYKKGRAIKAVIKEVNQTNNGSVPEIILSRRSDDFVLRLFEMEVPEVGDGIVLIKAIAREPGERMKVAVASVVDKIDPIGACVGLKGIRINSLITALGNETIDLIPYHDDPIKMIEKALSPAHISEIEIFPDTRIANVVLSAEQIPLAVGKNGLNIRLASRLTEYNINVINSGGDDIDINEFLDEIGSEILEKLLANNIKTAREFLEAEPDLLLNEYKIDPVSVFEIRRVLLLEFDEPESDEYMHKLKQASGIVDEVVDNAEINSNEESNDTNVNENEIGV